MYLKSIFLHSKHKNYIESFGYNFLYKRILDRIPVSKICLNIPFQFNLLPRYQIL